MKGMSQENAIDCDEFEVIDCDADSFSEDECYVIDSNFPFEDVDIYKWYDLVVNSYNINERGLRLLNNPSDLTDLLTATEWNQYKEHLIQSYKTRNVKQLIPMSLHAYERNCFNNYKLSKGII